MLAQPQTFRRREPIQIWRLYFLISPPNAVPPEVVREQINEVRFRASRVPDRSFFTFARPVPRRLGAQRGRARVGGLRRVPREGDVGVKSCRAVMRPRRPTSRRVPRFMSRSGARFWQLLSQAPGLCESRFQPKLKPALMLRALRAIRSDTAESQFSSVQGAQNGKSGFVEN